MLSCTAPIYIIQVPYSCNNTPTTNAYTTIVTIEQSGVSVETILLWSYTVFTQKL